MPPRQGLPLRSWFRVHGASDPACLQLARPRFAARWGALALLFSRTPRALDTLFTALGRPASSWLWVTANGYLESALRVSASGASGKDASHQPLQPTSVVTRTRWVPNSQARDLRRVVRRFLPDPPAGA